MKGLFFCFALAAFIALILTGCSFGTNQSHRVEIEEGKKEVTKSASQTDLQTETTKPLLTVDNSPDANITIDVQGGLPQEKVEATQAKEASEDTWMSMTLEESWEKFSGWVYLILASALAMAVKALKSLETTRTFSSVSGGLRVFGSVLSILEGKLRDMSPGTSEYEALRVARDNVKAKESRLQSKAKPEK